MFLHRLVHEQYYINPWGQKELRGDLFRSIDIAEVEPTGDVKMFNNGYEPPYECRVLGECFLGCPTPDEGRRLWVEIQNHIDYWGGTFYRPLFESPRDPALGAHEIGPHSFWEHEKKVAKMKLVTPDLRPVNIEGVLL